MRKALIKLTDGRGDYDIIIPCDGSHVDIFNKIFAGIKTFTTQFSILDPRLISIHFMEVENYEPTSIPEREPTIN